LSCTTTPIAAKTSVTVPMMTRNSFAGRAGGREHALTASDPCRRAGRDGLAHLLLHALRPKNRAASEITTTISGPIEKIE